MLVLVNLNVNSLVFTFLFVLIFFFACDFLLIGVHLTRLKSSKLFFFFIKEDFPFQLSEEYQMV